EGGGDVVEHLGAVARDGGEPEGRAIGRRGAQQRVHVLLRERLEAHDAALEADPLSSHHSGRFAAVESLAAGVPGPDCRAAAIPANIGAAWSARLAFTARAALRMKALAPLLTVAKEAAAGARAASPSHSTWSCASSAAAPSCRTVANAHA